MIFRLDERLIFPDPALAEEDGLLAIEGDLSASGLVGQVFVTPGTAAQPGLLSTAASPGLSGLSGLSGIQGSDGDVRLDDRGVRLDDDLTNVLWDAMSFIDD